MTKDNGGWSPLMFASCSGNRFVFMAAMEAFIDRGEEGSRVVRDGRGVRCNAADFVGRGGLGVCVCARLRIAAPRRCVLFTADVAFMRGGVHEPAATAVSCKNTSRSA